MRSPITFLDSLADTHAADNEATRPAGAAEYPAPDPPGDGVLPPRVAANRPTGVVHADEVAIVPGVSISDPEGTVHRVRAAGGPSCPTTRR